MAWLSGSGVKLGGKGEGDASFSGQKHAIKDKNKRKDKSNAG